MALFLSSSSTPATQASASASAPVPAHLRVSRWRELLGLLPAGDTLSWAALLAAQSAAYAATKQRIYSTIIGGDEFDPLLSSGSTSSVFYDSMERKKVIELDLSRVGDDLFYLQRKRIDVLLNVLFLWATEHPRTGYRQGMHEVGVLPCT